MYLPLIPNVISLTVNFADAKDAITIAHELIGALEDLYESRRILVGLEFDEATRTLLDADAGGAEEED